MVRAHTYIIKHLIAWQPRRDSWADDRGKKGNVEEKVGHRLRNKKGKRIFDINNKR